MFKIESIFSLSESSETCNLIHSKIDNIFLNMEQDVESFILFLFNQAKDLLRLSLSTEDFISSPLTEGIQINSQLIKKNLTTYINNKIQNTIPKIDYISIDIDSSKLTFFFDDDTILEAIILS